MRVGLGFDARPLEDGRPLLLGGVSISDVPGAARPADGDVVCGALAAALLGAAGLGSPRDPRCRGDAEGDVGDSLQELAEAVRRVEEENYQVVNVDVTVLAEGLELERHRRPMAALLAGVLHTAPEAVSVRRGPQGGHLGAGGEGRIAALAAALLNRVEDLDLLHAALRSRG